MSNSDQLSSEPEFSQEYGCIPNNYTLYAHSWTSEIHVSKRVEEMTFPSDIFARIFEYDKESALTLLFMQSCIDSRTNKEVTPEFLEKTYTKVSAIAKKLASQMEEAQRKKNRDVLSTPQPCSPLEKNPCKSLEMRVPM
jgi:hypothetical protein